MKEIVFEYEDLVIIDDEGCLTAVLLNEKKTKMEVVNYFDWLPPTNEDIIRVVKDILNDSELCYDIEEHIQAYKESELYKHTENYHNESEEY